MGILTEWTEENDGTFAEAVAAIDEDIAAGDATFEHSLQHYAALFDITEEALRHEWNLRRQGS